MRGAHGEGWKDALEMVYRRIASLPGGGHAEALPRIEVGTDTYSSK